MGCTLVPPLLSLVPCVFWSRTSPHQNHPNLWENDQWKLSESCRGSTKVWKRCILSKAHYFQVYQNNCRFQTYRGCANLNFHVSIGRNSSVGRALDWRSKGPRFNPGFRHRRTTRWPIIFYRHCNFSFIERAVPQQNMTSPILTWRSRCRYFDPSVISHKTCK